MIKPVARFVKVRRKRAIISLVFLGLLLLIFLGGGGYHGLFSPVDVTSDATGSYTVIGMERTGTYRKNHAFRETNILHGIHALGLGETVGLPVSITYDRYDKVKNDQKRSFVGYLLAAEAEIELPERSALSIQAFNITGGLQVKTSAHRAIGGFNASRRLKKELNRQDEDLSVAVLEIYNPAGEVTFIAPVTE